MADGDGSASRGAPVAWVFPGQGAQCRGMGGDLFDRYAELCREVDEILGYSVRDQCLDGASPGLEDTRWVQPALFVVGALTYLERRERCAAPDYVAGHSLGELGALFAAGCFDLATGVRLVKRRGELMAGASPGGMLAVVGAAPADVDDLLGRLELGDLDVANRNSATQVVLSGPDAALLAVAKTIRATGAGRCVPLRVSAPFHSRWMADAATSFHAFLADVHLSDPTIPVISNVTARPYAPGAVRENLARQVREGVRWWESMSFLRARGVEDVVEIGPGSTLATLWTAVCAHPCRDVGAATARDARGDAARADAVAPEGDAARAGTVAPEGGGARAGGGVAREPRATARSIVAERLGSADFMRDYGVRYAYLAGSMYKGISSTALVARMGKAGLMGFFGAGGCSPSEVEAAIVAIRAELGGSGRFGVNLLATPDDADAERESVDLLLRHDVRFVEAAGYTQLTAGLVRFRYSGANLRPGGEPEAPRRIVAKVSRPEVATAFMSPPPPSLLDALAADGSLTPAEVRAARLLPVSEDVCVEADSGGHTDGGAAAALVPAICALRDGLMARHAYARRIRVGAAGGIGSPAAAAAAFLLGADFVVTGSINQCSPEAGVCDRVKDMLASLDVHDTTYAPAGDMFEVGAKVQVVRKGTLFAARANKLYQLYRTLDGLGGLDEHTRITLEQRYFRRPLDTVWDETRAHLANGREEVIARAERNPKLKMALVFRRYFADTTLMALDGRPTDPVNYQIHCGPAQGAFNRVVAGSELEPWRRRHVDAIAELLMTGAAELLSRSLLRWSAPAGTLSPAWTASPS